MRNGHYTLRDLESDIIVTQKKGCVKVASGAIQTERARYIIRCGGGSPEWEVRIEWHEGKMLRDRRETWRREAHVNTIPSEFEAVAEAIRRSSGTHGGRRWGAGAKKHVAETERRKPRSFSLSDAEYARVKKYVEKYILPTREMKEDDQDEKK